MVIKKSVLNNIMHLMFALLVVGFVWFMALPDVAYADYNLEEGANQLLSLIKVVLLIVIIAAAIALFMRHQLMAALVVVVIGAVVIAAASPSVLEALGTSILNFAAGNK